MQFPEHLGASTLGLRPDGHPDLDDYHEWLVAEGLAEWGSLEVGAAPEFRPLRPPGRGSAPFPYDLDHHPTTWVADRSIEFLREVQNPTVSGFEVLAITNP